MFTRLKELIRTDQESLDKFEKIKFEFLEEKRAYNSKLLNKARWQAIVLALSAVISILVFVYAFEIKKQSKDEVISLKLEIELLQSELNEFLKD